MNEQPNLSIIQPAGISSLALLKENMNILKENFKVDFNDIQDDNSDWPFTSNTVETRVRQLTNHFNQTKQSYLLCSRGGYGCSELLDHIDWQRLSKMPAQALVGFSDISALHSALYTKLNIGGIHGPMIGSKLWDFDQDDTKHLLKAIRSTSGYSYDLGLTAISEQVNSPIKGKLFGGCLSVLTNLLGTEFFPKSLKNHILIIEDTGENPGQALRAWQQWLHLGYGKQFKAIILGQFLNAGSYNELDGEQLIYNKISSSVDCPVFSTLEIGHCKVNMPFQIGEIATIENNTLAIRFK